jgi:hypothetical protein
MGLGEAMHLDEGLGEIGVLLMMSSHFSVSLSKERKTAKDAGISVRRPPKVMFPGSWFHSEPMKQGSMQSFAFLIALHCLRPFKWFVENS